MASAVIDHRIQIDAIRPIALLHLLPCVLLQLAAAITLYSHHRYGTGKTPLDLLGYRKAAALYLVTQYQLVWIWYLPILILVTMLIPLAALLAAPLRAKLNDSPDYQNNFKRLILKPIYFYVFGLPLVQLWH